MNRSFRRLAAIGLLLLSIGGARADLVEALKIIKAVGPEGQGNAAASQAWPDLAKAGPAALPQILAAMDDAHDFALNWLRSAADAISDRARNEGTRLPLAELGEFLLDIRHHPRARRYAFELLARADAAVTEQLLPGMLNDPSGELRRDAVQRLLDRAGQSLAATNGDGAANLYRQALSFARDADQVELAADELRRLGRQVDLPRHFGFLTRWKIIGPFDNTGGRGFHEAFPPEREINLAAALPGKEGEVRWKDYESTDQFGIIDVNKPCGSLKGVTGYAYAEFVSVAGGPVELRLGSKNGWKIWCNGQFLFGRDEYHRGAEIDQYRMPVVLKPGRNALLVKLCQNEQTEEWTKEWEFQVRVCDAAGTAVLSTDRPPTPLAAIDKKPRDKNAKAN